MSETDSTDKSVIKFHRKSEVEVNVTARKYKSVMASLCLPDNYFLPGQKVLSVGEGLSDFSRELHHKGVNSVAVDLIYAFGSKSTSLNKAINGLRNEETTINVLDYRESMNIKNPVLHGPEIGRIAAADAAKLPFPDNNFDTVAANHITAYIDWEKTLPELVRVVKQGGEVRLGGVGLKILYNHRLIDSRLQPQFNKSVFPKKLPEAMLWLERQNNLKTWVIFNDTVPRPIRRYHQADKIYEKYSEPLRVAGVLIIKKGSEKTPITGYLDKATEEIAVIHSGFKVQNLHE